MKSMWTPEQVADFYQVPVQTIYLWRSKGYGPRPRKIGKHLRYKPDEVENFFD